MRKAPALVLALSLSIAGLAPASAATKAQTVTAAFKTLLNTAGNARDALDQKYESDLDLLDIALNDATIAAGSVYDSEMAAASSLYSPQISASNQRTSDAKTKFPTVSGIRVLALGTNRNYWGNISCPIARPDCKDPGDAGEKFVVGETTNIKPVLSSSSLDYLPEIDIMVSQGLIELLQPTEFAAVVSALKNEPANLKKITSLFSAAQSAAQSKKSRAIEAATSTRLSAISQLDDAFETAKAQLEAQEDVARLALLAAKRASKDSNFDTAFVIAYKFEYNRQMVGEIADAAWTGEWTYRTIDTILEVNRLAVAGDSIGAKYSKSQAIAFNSAVGNAFTNEPEFRAALKVLTAIYKQTTKTTLKF